MNNIFKYLLGICLLLIGSNVVAFTGMPNPLKDTIDPLIALMNIQESNRSNEYSWKSYVYFYEDVDTITVRDSAIMDFRHEGEKYVFNLGGVVYLQDQTYKVTVFNADSIIYIEKPSDNYNSFFQLDLFDSTLHQRYLNNILVSDSAGTRKITFLFKEEHPCIQYEIVYDTSSYLLRSIYYKLRKEVGTVGSPPTKYTSVKIRWTGLIAMVSEPDPIRSDRYFTRKNGVFIPEVPFTNYRIIDATKQ